MPTNCKILKALALTSPACSAVRRKHERAVESVMTRPEFVDLATHYPRLGDILKAGTKKPARVDEQKKRGHERPEDTSWPPTAAANASTLTMTTNEIEWGKPIKKSFPQTLFQNFRYLVRSRKQLERNAWVLRISRNVIKIPSIPFWCRIQGAGVFERNFSLSRIQQQRASNRHMGFS
jgi:hypothetical protein